MQNSILFKLFLLILLPLQLLSQEESRRDFNAGSLLPEKIISQSFLHKQIKASSILDRLINDNSGIFSNKTVLSGKFLLSEQITQNWDGSSWVNDSKINHTYTANDSLKTL